jgi:sterol desaturase/sphingolipid hydroxylase (fatty acid hydroxylase superfamily)
MASAVVAAVESAAAAASAAAASHASFLATPHAGDPASWVTLLRPWLVHFVFSWIGFTLYMVWDYRAYRAGTLAVDKLVTRHPVSVAPPEAAGAADPADGRVPVLGGLARLPPFWYAQLFMVPLVLYNQLVVWPLTSLLVVWPVWARTHRPLAEWGWGELVCTMAACFLVSDVMWYWSHRLMHVPWCWKHLHRMHHVAPQCAISATYVHPWEYTMWAVAMQLPWAVAGFPVAVYLVPLGWGMLTGSGAHSGYGGEFANGAKHNAHHYFHNVNFSLLMLADMVWGTHWSPGDPLPRGSALHDDVSSAFPSVFQVAGGLGEPATTPSGAGGKVKKG